jgi:hypothetical protein
MVEEGTGQIYREDLMMKSSQNWVHHNKLTLRMNQILSDITKECIGISIAES